MNPKMLTNKQPIIYMFFRPTRSDRCPATVTQRNPRTAETSTPINRKLREAPKTVVP